MKLTVEKVGKDYGSGHRALTGVSFELQRGVLGLLGPNGAGKSTLIRILATLSRATSGRVLWNGVDIARSPGSLRTVLGYLPQDFGVYPHLDATEFLQYMAAVKGLSRASAKARILTLKRELNIERFSKRRLGEYSQGMRQRVGIAVALLNDPKLLILDEASVGLDPEERVGLRNLLSDLAADRIIILSTHVVSDLEAIADEIAILSTGSLTALKSPAALLRDAQGHVWDWTVSDEELSETRRKFFLSAMVRTSGGVQARAISQYPPSATAVAVAPSLEDAYLYAVSARQASEAL